MKLNVCIGISMILLAFGCTPKQKGLIYFNDFESMKGWAPAYLNKEPHRSGQYSNKMDSVNIYGVTLRLPFKEVSDRKIKKVKVSFWALMIETNSKSEIVVEVYAPDKTKLFYLAKDMNSFVSKPKKWTEIKLEYTFPGDEIVMPQNIISVYPYNESKKDIYIDDLKIEFVI